MIKVTVHKELNDCIRIMRGGPSEKDICGFKDLKITEHSFFVHDFDDDEIVESLVEIIGRHIIGENVYLCKMGAYGYSRKIKEYYRLWKGLSAAYDIKGLVKYEDYKLETDEDISFCGIARVLSEGMKNMMEILLGSTGGTAFVYSTKNPNYVENVDWGEVFHNVVEYSKKGGYRKYNMIEVYKQLGVTGKLFWATFDGEEKALFVAEHS